MFKDGLYQHETGFIIRVINGIAYVEAGKVPLTLKTLEFLDIKRWEVLEDGNKK